MIPLAVPNLCGNEARYLQECVETNFVSSVGPFVERFEREVAAAAGSAAAVATTSGTAGLHAALVAVGVGRDDLVVLPSYTFIASANAIRHCGASPWLLDVAAGSWNLDPQRLAEALDGETEVRDGACIHRASGRRVAAVMPVHALGAPAAMEALVGPARARGLPVVADAAAALGASRGGRPVGALGADLSVFSFNGNKTVTAGGGGAVAGDDAALCDRVRHLTTTARTGDDYTHDAVGWNYRMTNLQAAVGCAQLERLEALVAAKRRIAARYTEALAGLPGLGAFPEPEGGESACWMSGVTLASRPLAPLLDGLRERGVGARPFWKPVHLQPPYRDCPRGELLVSERIWSGVLTLPCSTGLSEAEQEQVIEAVRALVGS